VEFPIGHARRREEGMPLLVEKFKTNLNRVFDKEQQERILGLSLNREQLGETAVDAFMDLLRVTR
jgi:2-methylcitrate dehydratase